MFFCLSAIFSCRNFNSCRILFFSNYHNKWKIPVWVILWLKHWANRICSTTSHWAKELQYTVKNVLLWHDWKFWVISDFRNYSSQSDKNLTLREVISFVFIKTMIFSEKSTDSILLSFLCKVFITERPLKWAHERYVKYESITK